MTETSRPQTQPLSAPAPSPGRASGATETWPVRSEPSSLHGDTGRPCPSLPGSQARAEGPAGLWSTQGCTEQLRDSNFALLPHAQPCWVQLGGQEKPDIGHWKPGSPEPARKFRRCPVAHNLLGGRAWHCRGHTAGTQQGLNKCLLNLFSCCVWRPVALRAAPSWLHPLSSPRSLRRAACVCCGQGLTQGGSEGA